MKFLEPFLFREHDSDKYLIPFKEAEIFDNITKKLDSLDTMSDEYYVTCDEFNDRFQQYVKEGELYSIPLYFLE